MPRGKIGSNDARVNVECMPLRDSADTTPPGCYSPRMKTGNNATLAAGALFVIAASIYVGTMPPEPMPVGIMNSLELRPALRLAAVAPLPDEEAAELEIFNQTTIELLERVAGKPLAGRHDRLAGAAASAAVGARHLVPLFIGPLAGDDDAADVLLRWALDPRFAPGPAELNRLRALDTEQAYRELAVTAVMAGSGRDLPETDLRLRRRAIVEAASFGLILAVPALIIWGSVWWFRWRRRQFAESMRERRPIELGTMRPALDVYIWFMVLFLSTNLLMPSLLARTDLSAAGMMLVTYLVMAAGGFTIALAFGRNAAEPDFRAVLGMTTRPGASVPSSPAAALTGGLRGYAMLWPIVLVASTISDIFGGGGQGLQDPLQQFIVAGATDVDRLILILCAAVIAPVFEETLFRGFFYRRFRTLLTPYGAAAFSGFIFAAAHLSTSGFLQVWAIGFTLALSYEQTGRLRSSMIAHGLWNLGTILSVIFMYG